MKKFAKEMTNGSNAYLMIAVVRTAKFGRNAGKVSIKMEYGYNPILDDADYSEYFTSEAKAISLLEKHGFFAVKSGFDKHEIADLKEIKEQLTPGWIEKFNLWANFTG